MSRIVLLTTFILCAYLPLVCDAQNVSRRKVSTMKFESEVWDFGVINEVDGNVSHVFKFRNIGEDAFVIEQVNVSCGCTHPTFSNKPILSGESGEVTITYDPTDRPGIFDKDIYVISDKGRNLNVLTIKGNVKGKPRSIEEDFPFLLGGIRFTDLSLNFGYVAQGKVKQMTIGYVNPSKKSIDLRFLQIPGFANVEIEGGGSISPGKKGEIVVSYNIPVGGSYGRISSRFVAIVDGRRQSLTFSSNAIVTDDLSVIDPQKAAYALFDPLFFHFGDVKKGSRSPLTKSFILRNDGKSELIIRSVSYKDNIIATLKSGTVIQPGKQISFEVAMDVTNEEYGLASGIITIVTNDPKRPLVELRVVADIVE